jgi:sugar phosphate isomerase/epimerase
MENTMSDKSLPILGVALPLEGLRLHRDWIIEKNRDLEIQDFIWAETLNGDWKPLADEIKKELDGHHGRVGIHGPFWGLSLDNMDPEIRAIVSKRMMQGLDVCAYLGATHMVIHSPYSTWDYNNLDDHPGSRAAIIDRVHETLKPAVKRAEDMGCVLVIENIEDIDPHARVELAHSFDSDAVRVSIDTGHANYAYGSTNGHPVDYYVHAAGDMLAHVHLQDTDGHADRHWAPGEGNISWKAVFRALSRLTSNPRLILELRDKTHVRAGADYLIGLGLAE